MTDRRDLLRAVLAAPDDDTPRLVYADWLDEHGTTDADAARAEFIRFSVGMKPGLRSSTRAMAERLRADWVRLLPTVVADQNPGVLRVRAQGRSLSIRPERDGGRTAEARVYYERGLAVSVLFYGRPAFDRFARALALDEPVARFEPLNTPHVAWTATAVSLLLTPDDWGQAVFDRMTRGPTPDPRRAIADAMTALARDWNGLTLSEPA